ncbi:MAG: LamG domain-containing protein [Phycisphaerae bacterium]|nr:LamG domain-containing protein [Phycisphaerae bacterium]
MTRFGGLCALLAIMGSALAGAGASDGLVAEWRFDDGQAAVVRDASGKGHDGRIVGATWVKLPKGGALRFDGIDDLVDCGAGASLDIAGPVTVEAWIHPARQAGGEVGVLGKFYDSYLLTHYTDGNFWWYIGSGSNHCKGKASAGAWQHVVATYDGTTLSLFINGRCVDRAASKLKPAADGRHFVIGSIAPASKADDPAYTKMDRFAGMIGGVRVYARAVSIDEIASHYKSEAADYGIDTTWFDRLRVAPFLYADRKAAVIRVDYRDVFPVPKDGRIEVCLLKKGGSGQPAFKKTVTGLQRVGLVEVAVPLGEIAPDVYVVRADLIGPGEGGRKSGEAELDVRPRPIAVPSPPTLCVGDLPAPVAAPGFGCEVVKSGGFRLEVGGKTLPFTTRVSWPNGQFNRLSGTDGPHGEGEKAWAVAVRPIDATRYQVSARGDHYAIDRTVEVCRDHVQVKDTYRNTGQADLGLLVYNELDTTGLPPFAKHFLGGWESAGRKTEEASPSVFAGSAGLGVGLVPLDDVFVVQSVLYAEPGRLGIGTEALCLAPGAEYSLEWAVYPTATNDYYEFINAVRRNEDRIGTVDGGFAFIANDLRNRRGTPSKAFVSIRNIKYGCIPCLSFCADDPGISIEGVEFMDFPKEMALLKQQIAEAHKQTPGLKLMFHVAHSLYATNKPDRFADSKVIGADGKQAVWEGGGYFSEERKKEGWNWYIYYPTPGNRLHDALMKSADVMMDDLGCDGVFMDGFMWGYRGRWTYDRWDGRSADIDPKTKTILRKKGSVLLLSQPSLIEFSRRIRDKGGVVVANNSVITRSIAREKYLVHDKEISAGPYLHLAPSVTALGNASVMQSEGGVYADILDKLRWGSAFFYYQEGDLTEETLASHQFPITFEEIGEGLIRGPERIVTTHSGAYGWAGDRRLHAVYKFDARGGRARHECVTTVDGGGARTRLELGPNESAVIERLPVTLRSDGVVNVMVTRYDAESAEIRLNGQGAATIEFGGKAALMRPGATYRVEGADAPTGQADSNGRLVVRVTLAGEKALVVRR